MTQRISSDHYNPKGLCYERITCDGIEHPNEDISLNINNLYDRCTFTNNIFRLLGIDNDLSKLFPGNKYFNSFYVNHKVFGLHSCCGVLINDKPIYSEPLDIFLSRYYPGFSLQRSCYRGKTIKEFVNFLYANNNYEYYNNVSDSYLFSLY